MSTDVTEADLPHLRRCVELAAEAVEAGDFPFGSVLVAADGTVLAEDRNREVTMSDPTRHPEFELARWAAENLPESERSRATVYTSGEHCPMCSAAHQWVGLGRIVYAASSAQLVSWLSEIGAGPSPVLPLAVNQVAPGLTVAGPAPELAARVRDLHRRHHAALRRPAAARARARRPGAVPRSRSRPGSWRRVWSGCGRCRSARCAGTGTGCGQCPAWSRPGRPGRRS